MSTQKLRVKCGEQHARDAYRKVRTYTLWWWWCEKQRRPASAALILSKSSDTRCRFDRRFDNLFKKKLTFNIFFFFFF